MPTSEYVLYPLGFLHSPLKEPGEAPRQGYWPEFLLHDLLIDPIPLAYIG
jgi:hypothetical protein